MPVPRKKVRKTAEHLPVFVYGTLRPGQKNYGRFLGGRTTAERAATVRGRLFYDEKEGYPYLRPGDGSVSGTLVFLASEGYAQTLERIDRLEDYMPQNEQGSLYRRRRTRATLPDATRTTAWVYYWNGPEVGRRIENGDFLTVSGRVKSG